jgi:preprotein translocase subunit YajC
MFVFSSRSRKKQEAKRREMLDAIQKGDMVTSIGGIIGTVVEVRERDVLIKIDDTTRIKLARWAIRGVGDDSVNEMEKRDGQK